MERSLYARLPALTVIAGVSLRALRVQRGALYKTLCSFAVLDTDDDLEATVSECKQVRTSSA